MSANVPAAGKIILINGPSSSGKSTLARRVQAQLEEPFWCFSIDHLRAADVLPLERIRSGEFDWPQLRPAFFDGFHRCLPELARAGNNLIVEHIVETPQWMRSLVELLDGLDVFFVGLHCPLAELERRELARGDRRIGEAAGDFEIAHRHAIYDLELESTNDPDSLASALVHAFRERTRPSAFEKLRAAQ